MVRAEFEHLALRGILLPSPNVLRLRWLARRWSVVVVEAVEDRANVMVRNVFGRGRGQ